jgi:predicted ABC-class ATPase
MGIRVRWCDVDKVKRILEEIDGKGYGSYRRRLSGCRYRVGGLSYTIARVQPDPYAPPSIVYVEGLLDLPPWARDATVAVADYLYRNLHTMLKRFSRKIGEGHSGRLSVPKPSNAMLRRSGFELWPNGRFIARVRIGLPSRRRRVLGSEAAGLLLQTLPEAFKRTLESLKNMGTLRGHVEAWKLQEELRSKLRSYKLVAFVGDGSILPRRCGGCEDPLPNAIPFESPPSLRVEIETSLGIVSGMGVREGFTVIAGAAFHGKTTLLEALQYGIYNHIPGDGRERVVSLRETVKVRTEDGRSVTCVDVSTFILSLPGGTSVTCFTTANASGATSTAAAIQEAVEAGAKLILLDEDTTATNILYYDDRVEHVVRMKTVATIAEQAHTMPRHGISIIVVSSGSAPLMKTADTVILMEEYKPKDITEEARNLNVTVTQQTAYKPPRSRRLISIPQLRKPKIRETWLTDRNLPQPINLEYNEQLVEDGQLNLLAALLRRQDLYENRRMKEIAVTIDEILKSKGFSGLLEDPIGPEYSEIRGLDFTYLLNRIPGIRVEQE